MHNFSILSLNPKINLVVHDIFLSNQSQFEIKYFKMCNKIIFCYCCILLIFCIKISLSAHGDEYPEDLECITIPENPKHLDDQWEKYKVSIVLNA